MILEECTKCLFTWITNRLSYFRTSRPDKCLLWPFRIEWRVRHGMLALCNYTPFFAFWAELGQWGLIFEWARDKWITFRTRRAG